MKSNLLILSVFYVFITFTACKEKSSDYTPPAQDSVTASTIEPSGNTVSVPTNENKVNSSNTMSSNCDKFLKEYESFTIEYMNTMKQFMSNPTNEALMNQIAGYDVKIKQFTDRYLNLMNDCASSPSFAQEYLNITNRLAKSAENTLQ